MRKLLSVLCITAFCACASLTVLDTASPAPAPRAEPEHKHKKDTKLGCYPSGSGTWCVYHCNGCGENVDWKQ